MGKVRILHPVISAVLALISASCSDIVVPPPTAPTGLTATLSAPTAVQLSWSPNPGFERIDNYFVYRSGVKVGESASTTFTDTGLAERATLKYSVVAVSKYGYESEQSPSVSISTGDATAPKVVQSYPANGTGPYPVVSGVPIRIAFNEAMDSSTINSSTLTVRVAATGAPIAGTINYDKRLATVTFASINPLPGSATINVVLSAEAKDLAGNSLSSPFQFSFTTTETTSPVVLSIVPANGATGVSLHTEVRITFSELMSFIGTRIYDQSSGITEDFVAPFSSAYDTLTNTQILGVNLKSNHRYLVSVGHNFPATDVAGNHLVGTRQFFFTTLDAGPPKPVSFSPAKDAVDVDPATAVRITFNEALDPATVNGTNLRVFVFDGGAPVSGTVSYEAATFTVVFTPAQPLMAKTKYSVFLSNLKDATGVPQEDSISYAFTAR